jgi:hypothetical protein
MPSWASFDPLKPSFDRFESTHPAIAGRHVRSGHLLASMAPREATDATLAETLILWRQKTHPGTHILDALCAARTAVR